MDSLLFLLIFLINFGCIVSEASLRYVFVLEKHDLDVPEQISKAIRTTEEAKPGIRISDDVIYLDRENEDDAYNQLCSSLSKGTSAVIDLTWITWDRLMELNLPVIRISLDSQPFVKAINGYLESRNATDASILVQSESDVDRTLYTLLGNSNVRVWVHPGLTRESAKSLNSMRPEPSFHIILGDHDFVTTTYKRAIKEKLVKRDFRWNVVVTDYEPFDPAFLVLPSVLLQLDLSECCKLLGVSECTCSPNVPRKQLILNNLLRYITEVLLKFDSGTTKILCDDIQYDNSSREMLYRVFREDSTNNESLFFWNDEESTLNLRTQFILSTFTRDVGLQRAAVWSAAEDYKTLPGFKFESLRDFFRIGTYPASIIISINFYT
ncbi:unnamed protein product [Leptosia nina]|uniref:Uncharacterized protein n=1 Tax=Leptosia nina TaxID=320188 RepID=A0AAV1K1Q3_9NEOP